MLEELDARFPAVAMLDAFGVVYPHYWLQGDCESIFRKHLSLIKEFYGEPKYTIRDNVQIVVPPILEKYRLKSE